MSPSVGVGGGGRVAVSARCHGRESCNCLCSLSVWQYTDADIVLSVIGDRVDGLGGDHRSAACSHLPRCLRSPPPASAECCSSANDGDTLSSRKPLPFTDEVNV